jgi:membrane protein implicated in regulation of membrane protease activity
MFSHSPTFDRYDPPSIIVPTTFVVAVSGMFAFVPLLISVPLAYGTWAVTSVIAYIGDRRYLRKQEEDSLDDRMKRWYGKDWEQARKAVIFDGKPETEALDN